MTSITMSDAQLTAAIAEQNRWLAVAEREESERRAAQAVAAAGAPVNLAAMSLDDLIRLEDAVDSLLRGWTAGQHASCYKPELRASSLAEYAAAVQFAAQFSTTRKAMNAVSRAIDTHR